MLAAFGTDTDGGDLEHAPSLLGPAGLVLTLPDPLQAQQRPRRLISQGARVAGNFKGQVGSLTVGSR